MKKRKWYHLTNSELALMQVLWSGERPMSRSEIMDEAIYKPEKPFFAATSFHIIINDLLDKEYIVAVTGSGKGRTNARRFAPTVTRNEYFALQILSTENYQTKDIPDIVAALVKNISASEMEDVLDGIEEFLRKKRK